MSRRGRMVVLEGLDGVGKSTLARAMPGFVALATPGDELRDARRAIHAAAAGDPLVPQLFYAASVCAVGRRARALADAGADVVIDRYWLSTIAYGLARGTGVALVDVAPRVPRPDVTVIVELHEDERRARLAARGMTAQDVESLQPPFAEAVRRRLRAPAPSEPVGRLARLDVTGLALAVAARRLLDLV